MSWRKRAHFPDFVLYFCIAQGRDYSYAQPSTERRQSWFGSYPDPEVTVDTSYDKLDNFYLFYSTHSAQSGIKSEEFLNQLVHLSVTWKLQKSIYILIVFRILCIDHYIMFILLGLERPTKTKPITSTHL